MAEEQVQEQDDFLSVKPCRWKQTTGSESSSGEEEQPENGPHAGEEGRNQTGHNGTDMRDSLPVEAAAAAATCRLATP
eukprot:2032896-Rhodomonas_salina.5